MYRCLLVLQVQRGQVGYAAHSAGRKGIVATNAVYKSGVRRTDIQCKWSQVGPSEGNSGTSSL